MKFLLLFILGFGICYMLRRSLMTRRQQNQKPPMRTVAEASAERPLVVHREKNKR